jgi:hypothetical protein
MRRMARKMTLMLCLSLNSGVDGGSFPYARPAPVMLSIMGYVSSTVGFAWTGSLVLYAVPAQPHAANHFGFLQR